MATATSSCRSICGGRRKWWFSKACLRRIIESSTFVQVYVGMSECLRRLCGRGFNPCVSDCRLPHLVSRRVLHYLGRWTYFGQDPIKRTILVLISAIPSDITAPPFRPSRSYYLCYTFKISTIEIMSLRFNESEMFKSPISNTMAWWGNAVYNGYFIPTQRHRFSCTMAFKKYKIPSSKTSWVKHKL